jgi:phenylacetate-CoA ligase
MEDVAVFEFVDTETLNAVPTGEAGDIVFTHLHRQIPLLIRYNLRDLGRIKHEGGSALGSNFRRMDKFLGRSDQMVKIRGTNVYPMGCLRAVRSDERATGEWLCVAKRFERSGVLRDELVVRVEVKSDSGPRDGLVDHLTERLRADLGIKPIVELAEEGQLDTNVGKEGKPRRLVDERNVVVKADG